MAKSPRKVKWMRRMVLFVGVLAVLEFFPGAYTIDDFQDEWDLDSPEGVALMALEDLELDAVLEFDRTTRQRISRNAEILVPEDTVLTLTASMTPLVEEGEAVARPRTWDLRSSRYMTFVYRGVTVARARNMRIRSDDPELRVRAIGMYRVLSALITAHRYHRQMEVRRDYKAPDRAALSLQARFLKEHPFPVRDTMSWSTGSEISTLTLKDLTWDRDRWTGGWFDLDLHFADPEPVMNGIATEEFTDPIELGDLLVMKFRRLHALTLVENGFFMHFDGSITSANSSTVEGIFDPSFESRLELAFTFPEGQTLEDAVVSARVKQIHSFDINRSHNLLDKAVRNLIRAKRDQLQVEFPVAGTLPEHPAIPRNLTFDLFGFQGNENRDLEVRISGFIPSQVERIP